MHLKLAKLTHYLTQWTIFFLLAVAIWIYQTLFLQPVKLPPAPLAVAPQTKVVTPPERDSDLRDPEYVVTPRGTFARYRIGSEHFFYRDGKLVRQTPVYLPKL